MKTKYILSLDQGTSSSRAVLFNHKKQIVGMEQVEYRQYYPENDRTEHNPHEIWEPQLLTAKTLLTKLKVSPKQIQGIGITNQRETTIVWDKQTGEPIYNAIVWQDKRTANLCEHLKEQGLSEYVQENTGLIIDAYFSGTKVQWILQNVKGAKKRAEKGELLFGTVDTWLVWKLSGGKLHITDYSNASRTMLFNIKTLEWDAKLCSLMGIPMQMLPEVRNSSEVYGTTAKTLFEGVEIPIAGIAGDQQAALFGQKCFSPGATKNTYGTGCFMLMNTGNKIIESKNRLLTTIAWGLKGEITYALEGSVFIAGAAIKWLRDGIKIIRSSEETENLALGAKASEGVYFVPAFAGLGAPHWDMYARGGIFGLTQGVTEKDIVRATLESLAYQSKDIIEAMCADSEINLTELRVDGGASVNNFLMQFQADILNTTVSRPEITESSALGAAFLAGIATEFWSMADISEICKGNNQFISNMSEHKRNSIYSGWKAAVAKCKS